MDVLDRSVRTPVSGPQIGAVIWPAWHHVKVEMVNTLPGMATTRVQHHDTGRGQSPLHGLGYALREEGCSDEYVSACVEDAYTMRTRDNERVPRRQRAACERQECDSVPVPSNPSSVT
jgi:hypothetical protein